MTSKELILATLDFTNANRIPRQLWVLPWAEIHHPQKLQGIQKNYPDDIITCPSFLARESPVAEGDPYVPGDSIDEWGCRFTSIQNGIFGEVKNPIVTGDEWEDAENVHIPVESLSVDAEAVNEFCKDHADKFILAGCLPRPFERLQFIRSTERLYIDLVLRPDGMINFIKKMHDFYCEELTLWAKTDVDALFFMDDWGSQKSLLVNPALWEEFFKPMYRDYIDIAHSHGKKAFMHSDGYIVDILPHLIDLGLDAINSQLFCMGLENLEQFKGKITFWGEMDRQHLLPRGTPEQIKDAVHQIHEALHKNGGCIAQCEFGPGANPDNVFATFEAWDEL